MQPLHKFRIIARTTKDMDFINSNYYQISLRYLLVLYLHYTNAQTQKQNEHVFLKTIGLTFIFNAINIHHQSCPPSSKLTQANHRFVFFFFALEKIR